METEAYEDLGDFLLEFDRIMQNLEKQADLKKRYLCKDLSAFSDLPSRSQRAKIQVTQKKNDQQLDDKAMNDRAACDE